MAYSGFYSSPYQPYTQPTYQPQMPQNQVNTGVIWIQGESGAKSYLVAPNSTVTLWDSEAQTIYIKSADATGMPSIRTLDYSIRGSEPKATVNYATEADFDQLKKEIDEIKKSLGKEKK